MAFPVTINGRTYTLADFEGTNYVDGFPDALEDFVTQAGDIYNSTSTSSVAIGTGSKSFTTADSDKPYQVGTPLRIADAANPETNFMDCIVTSYSGTSLVVDAFGFAGSGTISSWTINIGGAKTVDGTLAVNQGGTGATTASAARTNLGLGSIATQDADSVNIDGGAIDGVTLGTNSAVSSAVITTADINGGTIDGVTIGGASAGAVTATTITGSGDMNIDSGTLFVDASADAVGIGTTSPSQDLQLSKDNANVNFNIVSSNTGNATVLFGDQDDISMGSVTYDNNVNAMIFKTNNQQEAARFNSSLNLAFPNGQGIDFSASEGGGASSSVLDDYEEGTFQATLTPQGGTLTMQSLYDTLAYTKIGRTVHIHGFLQISSVSSPTGYVTCNLPFTPANLDKLAGRGTIHLFGRALDTGNASDVLGVVFENNSTFAIYNGDAVSEVADFGQSCKSGTSLYISGTYLTS